MDSSEDDLSGLNGLSVADAMELIKLTTTAAQVAISDPRNRAAADHLLQRLQRQIAAMDGLGEVVPVAQD